MQSMCRQTSENRTELFWVITQRVVVISYRRFLTRFGTTVLQCRYEITTISRRKTEITQTL